MTPTENESMRLKKIPNHEGYTTEVLRYIVVDVETEKELTTEDWIREISNASSSDLTVEMTEVLKVRTEHDIAGM